MKRHKYHAQPTVVDGIRFASKAEATRYGELRLLERVGAIRGLELQPSYKLRVPLVVGGRCTGSAEVGAYRADFRYERREHGQWVTVVEDVKGVRTPVYRLKKRMVEAQYGIEIAEVAA